MDERSSKGPDVPKTNKNVPRGLLYRELGFKQKQGRVSSEFQRAAEDRLVVKNHEELPCELPDASRSTFLMVFSPDGTKVASTHGNHNVYVTDLNTGKNVKTLSGHPRTPWCITFHPSSNQILASGCLGGQVRVWDLHGGSEMWTAESQTVIASLAFHPTDRILVIATYNELLLWDWSQPAPFTKCDTSNEREKVRYVAFDPLGHKLITGISNAPHNQTQWDRIAAPASQGSSVASTSHSYHPRSPVFPPDRERRMAVCYRSLVAQYEQLVQRYYNLSRSRTPTMDRGTDPMDLSELSPAGLQSGSSRTQSHTQMGCVHVQGMNRFLMHDNNSSSGDNSSANGNGNENSSSAAGASSGGPCCGVRSVLLSRVRNTLQRHAQQRPASFNTLGPLSERVGAESIQAAGHCSADRRDSARSVSSPTRRFELDNINDARHGVHLEYGEQGFDMERTSLPHSSDVQHVQAAIDPARRRRSLDGERQIVPDCTRDQRPAVTHSSLPSEHRVSFARFHSQALPHSACPAERPRRFFVSQRSAFHPRTPRGDQHPHSESQFTARPPSGIQTPRSCYVLHRRLRDAYHLQNFQDDNEMSTFDPLPHQALDSTSDVGVRYGIQLLSRHIDNMQRLCRARLEILQLQQIRRMWEDLQQQIRSLHVAVRESTFALTGAHNVLGGRGRRRFRLYSHSGEDSELGVSDDVQLRQNNQRSGESEAGATEQGPHIPSVSQMLKSAHISDTGPPSNSSQNPACASGASPTHEQPVPSEQGTSNQDCFRSLTLKPLHTKFEILTEMKLAMDEKNCAKLKGETSINNVASTSKSIGTTNGDTAANRFMSSDGEQSVSQCAKPVSFGDHEGSAEEPACQDLPESVKRIRTSDLLGEGDNLKVKNIRYSPYGECSKTASPYKKQRGDGADLSERCAPVDISCNPQSDSCNSVTGEGVCASSSGNTPVVSPVNTTTASTTTTVTSSTVDPSTVPSSSAVHDGSSEASAHLPSSSWCRYGSANAITNTNVSADTTTSTTATAASSQHHRLWRISRRVYLRRPRLLALGPRSRTVFRQLSGNNASSQKNCSAGVFRSATGEDVCASSSSSTPVVSPVNTTTASTTTTVTSSTVDPSTVPSSSAVHDGSSEASAHLPSSSWCRYGSANATTNTNVSADTTTSTTATTASSQHHRLWRISRRVHLRRPRLLAQGPRSRTIFRQLSGNNASSQKNCSAGVFRHHESGRRPWFMQSGPSRSQHTRLSSRGINTSAQVGTPETTLSNFAKQCGSNESGASSGDHKQVNSDALISSETSPRVSESDQSSSSGKAQQSAGKPKLDTSAENDIQPGPSRQQEHVSFSASSLADKGDTSGKGNGKDVPRRTSKGAGHDTGTGESDSSRQTQREPTIYGSFRAVAARLQSLIRQRREQQESLRRENLSGRQSQQTDMWELRDRHLWFRGDTNSGSDSDSNPESDRHQAWEWPAAADRLIMAIENETSNSSMFGSRRGRSGALDEDWEWTRESTRLRARQVLGLMVESLTQFFEENGLSGSASHAVLDEQLYNLYILLQLALELTDLLLAQLFSTRQELEHQWMHRLHSPVALDAATLAGQHQLRRCSGTDRPQQSHSLWQEYLGHERPYRRLLRYRHHPFIEAGMRTQLHGVPGPITGVRSSPRRLNCYSRRESHTAIAATLRTFRELGGRPLMRGAIPRRANTAYRLPPYTRTAGIRSASTSRETGHHLRTFEEPSTTGSSEIRSPHTMATDGNSVPIASMPLSVNQQNKDGFQQQQQPQGQQQQPQGQQQQPQGQQQQPQGRQQQQQQQPQGRQQQQQQQDTFTVPLVQVNDVLIPDTSVLNQPQPRQRPQSPPPHLSHLRNPFIQQQQQSQHTQSPLRHLGDSWRYAVHPGYSSWRSGLRSHFLHPRYMGQNPFSEDQDLIGPTLENINIIRDSFIITDAPMSPNHRIQVWDFTKFRIPDISDAEKNVVVAECRIQNDASVDVSNDGRLLVTLLPTGRLSSTDMLGVYSLEWESLGQCLYTTSFEQSAVSVSLSPAGHHLLVGFASRRVALLPTDRHTMAQIFRLEGGLPGRTIGARGRLCHIRDIEQDREQGYMSLNCIRWAPSPGQGLVYGTNTGKLKVLQ